MTTSINKTETFVVNTWINCKKNEVFIYKGSDGKHYFRSIGVPLTEIDSEFVEQLIWLDNNRTRRAA